MTKRGGEQASLAAFDLLRLSGNDLRLRPIEEWRNAPSLCAFFDRARRHGSSLLFS
jgi:ATP-dependent DNA ligase